MISKYIFNSYERERAYNDIIVNFPSNWLQLDVARDNITDFSDIINDNGGADLLGEKIAESLYKQIVQYIQYAIGCNENIMHFESPKGIEINILYGKWWPEAIEIKNKEIPGRLRDWFFYQNFIYTDENGKRHECEFWGTEEYNQDMYIIESINLRENGQLVKRAIIIKKEKEDYIMAELSEAEIVFKIFAEKHK